MTNFNLEIRHKEISTIYKFIYNFHQQGFEHILSVYFLGVATWTKHYRNGVELPEIARDDNYDFNFQVVIGFQPVLSKFNCAEIW